MEKEKIKTSKCEICKETDNDVKVDFCCYENAHIKCLDKLNLKCGKCKEKYNKEKVYFAGKIYDDRDSNYPRINLITDTGCGSTPSDKELLKAISELKEYEIDKFSYIINGPCVVGCDHKCFHGEETHGVKGSEFIVKNCMEQIKDSDVVIARINKDIDCYATLMEIGYAIGLKKPVYIVSEDNYYLSSDLWFIKKACIDSLNCEKKYRKIRMYSIFSKIGYNFKSEEEYFNSL